MFTIETKSAATGNAWTTEGLGDAAEFESEELAEETIDDLRGLGPDWSEAEYRVVEVAGPVGIKGGDWSEARRLARERDAVRLAARMLARSEPAAAAVLVRLGAVLVRETRRAEWWAGGRAGETYSQWLSRSREAGELDAPAEVSK